MIVADVMDELATALRTIAGLRVFAWPPGGVTPPAAIVGYPDSGVFDEVYRRGADSLQIPIAVIVGRPTDRCTRDALSGYASGSGTSAIKQVVDTATYTTCDEVRVASWETDTITIGSIDYLAAVFDVAIIGRGTA
jgi:hypothetical protein